MVRFAKRQRQAETFPRDHFSFCFIQLPCRIKCRRTGYQTILHLRILPQHKHLDGLLAVTNRTFGFFRVSCIVIENHFEEDGQIISRDTIEQSIDSGEAYRILSDGDTVGGAVIKVDGKHGDLELLFIKPDVHSKGIGYAAWCAIEKLHPEVEVWETITPYFEKRNIHFYVNRCGFHIVEYLNKYHPGNFPPDEFDNDNPQFPAGMFRFEKKISGLLVRTNPPN